jgi:hypothetical protein
VYKHNSMRGSEAFRLNDGRPSAMDKLIPYRAGQSFIQIQFTAKDASPVYKYSSTGITFLSFHAGAKLGDLPSILGI